jgi:hypothetical protein
MKLSQLLIARKNSKFLMKFLISWLKNTKDFNNVELLIMVNEGDTWNQDFLEYFKDKFQVFKEDWGMGKEGRAEYYNELAKHATGDYLWHMCDDHNIIRYGYDEFLINYIKDNQIDPNKVNIICPAVENAGRVAHMLSRGWYNVVGRMGGHGAIDSYINTILDQIVYRDQIYEPGEVILTDFTPYPEIMTFEHCKTELKPIVWADMTSPEIQGEIKKDARKLFDAIQYERNNGK